MLPDSCLPDPPVTVAGFEKCADGGPAGPISCVQGRSAELGLASTSINDCQVRSYPAVPGPQEPRCHFARAPDSSGIPALKLPVTDAGAILADRNAFGQHDRRRSELGSRPLCPPTVPFARPTRGRDSPVKATLRQEPKIPAAASNKSAISHKQLDIATTPRKPCWSVVAGSGGSGVPRFAGVHAPGVSLQATATAASTRSENKHTRASSCPFSKLSMQCNRWRRNQLTGEIKRAPKRALLTGQVGCCQPLSQQR